MSILDLIKKRRSIRKYEDKKIPKELLEKIIEAGIYAPNAGGGQRSMIVAINDASLTEKIGKLNIAHFDRTRLIGNYVSKEQPSVIDDPNMKSGFYGAQAVCCVFCEENFLFSIPDAFCCAENMVLMATELGLGSCIVSRAEDTFLSKEGQAFLEKWNVPKSYIARCFVVLGYVKGVYPQEKPRHKGRALIID